MHGRKKCWADICCAVAVNCVGISLCLNTFWLTIITGAPFLGLLPTRLAQNLIMVPVQFIMLYLLRRPLMQLARRQVA